MLSVRLFLSYGVTLLTHKITRLRQITKPVPYLYTLFTMSGYLHSSGPALLCGIFYFIALYSAAFALLLMLPYCPIGSLDLEKLTALRSPHNPVSVTVFAGGEGAKCNKKHCRTDTFGQMLLLVIAILTHAAEKVCEPWCDRNGNT